MKDKVTELRAREKQLIEWITSTQDTQYEVAHNKGLTAKFTTELLAAGNKHLDALYNMLDKVQEQIKQELKNGQIEW